MNSTLTKLRLRDFYFFQECRKVQKAGLAVACDQDEIALGCQTAGFGQCEASRTFNAKGCLIMNCNDSGMGRITALCCKEVEHNWND